MDFLAYIETPVGRLESNPIVTRLRLTRGRLKGGFLFFPSGPAGNLHFVARMGIHQVVPFNTGSNYNLNNCVIPFEIGIDLTDPPYEIECITWNESALYSHALTACFFLDPDGLSKKTLTQLKEDFSGTKGYYKP